MKTWAKVLIGTLAGAAVGVVAACIGKSNDVDEDLVPIDEETDNCDSDSDEEVE